MVDDKIAISFDEKRPKTKIATEPLTPISAIVIVGVIVIKKKINITFVEYFSLLATWILIGMWHGPTLNYALFGFMQFVFIILFRFLSKGKIKNKSFFKVCIKLL